MIALLTGVVAHKTPDRVIVDVHGVGYDVQIPFSTYYDLPEDGGSCTLHIHTNVKEDAITLYGFRTPREKGMFQLLISVSGVGPKLAVGILSNIPAADLAAALLRGDAGRLAMVPGIGKKTAERLVLELKEKIRKHEAAAPSIAEAEAPVMAAHADVVDDVSSALVNLGYKEQVVRKVLDELKPDSSAGVEEVLKLALKKLMK